MKALTLHQPWATLVAAGAKTIETRFWKPNGVLLGERIAIHAAKAFPNYGKEACVVEPFRSVLTAKGCIETDLGVSSGGRLLHGLVSHLPLGAIVCTANFVGCVPTRFCSEGQDYLRTGYEVHTRANGNIVAVFLSEQEAAFGNYGPGVTVWLLEDIQPLPEPIPARGFQQLWETDLL